MARYRVLAPTFIGHGSAGAMRQPGEIVEYAGRPGSSLQALDVAEVEIPVDWQSLNGLQRIHLARSLGAPKQRISAAQADEHIAKELAARDAAKPVVKSAPSKPAWDDDFPATPSAAADQGE